MLVGAIGLVAVAVGVVLIVTDAGPVSAAVWPQLDGAIWVVGRSGTNVFAAVEVMADGRVFAAGSLLEEGATDRYPAGAATNPTVAAPGSSRARRGGAFADNSGQSEGKQAWSRAGSPPTATLHTIGFCCAYDVP